MKSKDRDRKNRRIAAGASPSTSDPVAQAGKLWQQHCSWCPRCTATKPECELGQKGYALYQWLARLSYRRAG